MFTDISLPTVTEISSTDTEGSFIVEPIWPGYGQTIGNALRRTLLSSLPGAAITSIRIDSITHEFSTLPGIEEDIVELLLNLKKVHFRYLGEEPIAVTIAAKGSKTISAADIEAPAGIEVTSPDVIIAHLSGKGALKLSATVERGRGFSPTEERPPLEEAGRIAVDAHFSPVNFVNFEVEHTRVGEVTNFDKLTLLIKTDGSISPKEALDQSARLLVNHFNLFVLSTPTESTPLVPPTKGKRKKAV